MPLKKCGNPHSNGAPLKKTRHPKQCSLDVSNTDWTTCVTRWVVVSSERRVKDIMDKVLMKRIF
jgi:hypothetical protein